MARLHRPHVPLKVRCVVAARQLGYFTLIATIMHATHDRMMGRLLDNLLDELARSFGCEVDELRLDHNPPLGARPKTGEGKRTVYEPDANDPEHLLYRPHGAQHEGSHDVKTRIRGDRGQYSDIVLIKRQRRRERAPRPKAKIPNVKRPWPKRPFAKGKNFKGRGG